MKMAVDKKKKETLYSVLRPLIAAIYVVGWHSRNGMSTGLKVAKYSLMIYAVVYVCELIRGLHGFERKIEINRQNAGVALETVLKSVNIFCLLYAVARVRALDQLMDQLKTISLSSYAGSRLRVVKIILLTMLVSCGSILACQIGFGFCEDCFKPVSVITAIATALVPTYLLFLYISRVPFSMFAAFLALFICCVAYFVKVSLEESLSELKRCKSMERRNRLIVKAMDRYHALYRFSEKVNRFGAPLMFAIKATAASVTALSVYYVCSQVFGNLQDLRSVMWIFITFMNFQYLAIYLWFLRVAPSANNFMSTMSGLMLESILRNDQWLSPGHAHSRPRLLRMRVQQLSQLVHLHFEPPFFTILSDEVDDNDFFTIFFDVMNGLSSRNFLT